MLSAASTKEEISNFKIILGLLKEAIFLKLPANFGPNGTKLYLKVVDERDPRQQDATRTIVFEPDSSDHAVTIDSTQVRFEIFFPRFTLEFFCAPIGKADDLRFSFPELVTVVQRRAAARKGLANTEYQPVVYEYEGLWTEGALRAQDLSADSLGAHMRFPAHQFTPQLGALVSGVVQVEAFEIRIDAKITRVTPLKGQPGFEVGLTFNRDTKDRNYSERSVHRFSLTDTIRLASVQSRNAIPVKLKEASFLGFSGNIDNANSALPLGLTYTLEGSSLKFRVVGFEGNILRFALDEGSTEDRLKWAKHVSRTTFHDVQTRTEVGDELIRLMCEAGAIPQELLSRGTLYKDEFLEPLNSETDDSFWVFRWINAEQAGPLKGHISAIRYGDNAWFLGDIASGSDTSNKISPNFIARFGSAFRDFSRSQSPCPRILGLWKAGHPRWGGFEKFLESAGASGKLFGSFHIGHTKLAPAIESEDNTSFQVREVRSEDAIEIQRLIHALRSRSTYELAASMDFSLDRLSSPLLRNTFRTEVGFNFARRYFTLSGPQFQFLFVLSRLPLGSSFNQVMSSAFVFQTSGLSIDAHTWGSIVSNIQRTGLEHGMVPTSIRRIVAADAGSTKMGEEGTLVHAFLFHHDLLSFFDTKERSG